MMRAMCGVQLKDRKRSTDLMFMLSLNETIDQLAMANSVRWYGDVLRSEDGHVFRRALDFEVEDERNRETKTTWEKQVWEDCTKEGLCGGDALCRLKWILGISQIITSLT